MWVWFSGERSESVFFLRTARQEEPGGDRVIGWAGLVGKWVWSALQSVEEI